MTLNATSLTSWTKTLKVTLDKQGIDTAALFEQAGLDVAALSDPNARYATSGTRKLWKLAVEATGNPNLGLDVGRNVTSTTFHALGYSLLASPTLMEVFERAVRYFRIISDSVELAFEKEKQSCKFIVHMLPGEAQPAEESIDAVMSVMIRLCRTLYGPEFRARQVIFRRPQPLDVIAFEKVFKAPLAFDANESAIYIDRKTLESPLPTGNADLARHNDEILARYLALFDRENVANRVHAVLVELLPEGEPSQEKVAQRLHMSLRNLQRKLQADGATYKEILNKTRHELALSYMAESSYSISEITYLLGFSDTSSFTRAFKRWTGKSPSEYRQSR